MPVPVIGRREGLADLRAARHWLASRWQARHFWLAYGGKMLVDLVGEGDERLVARGHPLLCGCRGTRTGAGPPGANQRLANLANRRSSPPNAGGFRPCALRS
jgi:hypothetical protein